MAAPVAISDHKLEERIYRLQKLKLDNGVKRIVEEALQLCNDGRHLESSALIEKAEAMHSAVSPTLLITDGLPPAEPEGFSESATEQGLAQRLVVDISSGLTKVLVRAIGDLERHMTGETKRITSTFGPRLDKLQNGIESLQPLNGRLDELAQAGAAAQQKFEHLTANVAALQTASTRHDAELETLRLDLKGFSALTVERIDDACRKIDAQEREIAGANSTISGLVSRMASTVERLERHADAIRALHQGQQQRTDVLSQVAEVLGRIRVTAENAPAITV